MCTAGRTTLAEVAARAGVSLPTASKVLNGRPDCWASEETRERIRAAVTHLGYRPNLSARGLALGRSNVIGLIAPGFLAGAHSRAEGLTGAAAAADYTVTLTSHPNESEAEDLAIRRLLDRGVDGLVVYPVDSGPHAELRRLVESGFPVVTFEGASLLEFECDDVSVDYAEVGRLQARHLLALGRRRVCLLAPVPEARINRIREEGARSELLQAGAAAPLEARIPQSVEHEITESAPLAEALRARLLECRGSFDGLLALDSMASLAIRILQEQGLRVPEDVAVVGAGNTMLADYGMMALTSVDTADDKAGERAFALLLDRIGNKDGMGFRRLTSAATLIARKSTQV